MCLSTSELISLSLHISQHRVARIGYSLGVSHLMACLLKMPEICCPKARLGDDAPALMGYSQVVTHEAGKQRIGAARGLQAGVALVARAGQLLLGAGLGRVRMPLRMPHAPQRVNL